MPSDSWLQDKIGFIPSDKTKQYIKDLNNIAIEATNILNELIDNHDFLEKTEMLFFLEKEIKLISKIYDNVYTEQNLIDNINKVYSFIEMTEIRTIRNRLYECLVCLFGVSFIICGLGVMAGW